MALLYMITFPNNKKYIGITSGLLKKRLSKHRRVKTNYPVNNAFKKYKDDFTVSVVDNLSFEDAKEYEKAFIDYYHCFVGWWGSNGYNATLGGDGAVGTVGNKGRKHTEETRMKISIANTGKKATAETKEKQAKRMKGNQYTKGKRGEWTQTEESNKKRSLSHSRTWYIELPNKEQIIVTNLYAFCKAHRLQQSNFIVYGHTKGYKLIRG